jgi:hypothetical protein
MNATTRATPHPAPLPRRFKERNPCIITPRIAPEACNRYYQLHLVDYLSYVPSVLAFLELAQRFVVLLLGGSLGSRLATSRVDGGCFMNSGMESTGMGMGRIQTKERSVVELK